MAMTFEWLFQFGYFPYWNDNLEYLANLAEPEDWEYKNTESDHERPILHNYLHYTFLRLQELQNAGEHKFVEPTGGDWTCFNTGLVTIHQEPIFALLQKHNNPSQQPWFFKSFEAKSAYALAQFSELPSMAHYFDEPAELIYDSRLEFRANIEHIILDNRERFPERHQQMNDYELQTVLRGALENARERVRRNYKAAVPQYYKGGIQLLLPLCLSQPESADLALVVKNHGAFYRASTCLTLDMAYNNARLIARPDRDWLQP